jgi:hypothetical protein
VSQNANFGTNITKKNLCPNSEMDKDFNSSLYEALF